MSDHIERGTPKLSLSNLQRAFVCFQVPVVLIDTFYFGKLVIAPLNIMLYNVLSDHGPDLYGEWWLRLWTSCCIMCWVTTDLISMVSGDYSFEYHAVLVYNVLSDHGPDLYGEWWLFIWASCCVSVWCAEWPRTWSLWWVVIIHLNIMLY